MEYSGTTADVLSYIKANFGADPEFLWAKTPNTAAFRHYRTRKWFAALLLDLPRKTLGLSEPGRVDILNLKCDPLMIGSLMDGKRFLPGYHMNKEHWITVLLDGSIPPEEIFPLIDLSYALTGKAASSRKRSAQPSEQEV